MRRRIYSVLLVACFAALALVAPSASAQFKPKSKTPAVPPTSGMISGTVNDNHGSPLSGARVVLTNEATKEVTNASTDGSGSYRFDELKPGNYSLDFQSKGFQDKSEHVKVKLGKDSNVSPRMKLPATPYTKPVPE
jgi:protocatechuate 3,4-dioxygenase beta subunit